MHPEVFFSGNGSDNSISSATVGARWQETLLLMMLPKHFLTSGRPLYT